MGSSFLPSDIIAAFLWAQLENLEKIQARRKLIWSKYYNDLYELSVGNNIMLPIIPSYATNNAHMFYMVVNSLEERIAFIDFLKKMNIMAVFHYISLHSSAFHCQNSSVIANLPQSDLYSDRLIRLPLFYDLEEDEIIRIIQVIKDFYAV